MRHLFFLSLITSSLLFGAKEVDQKIHQVFVPEGFDNNDSVQLVLTGKFANSCYQLGLYTSEVDTDAKTITLRVTSFLYNNRCLQVEVPFFQTVYLGRLREAGTYKIMDATSNQEVGNIKIAVAPPEGTGTDDSHYATVLDAYLTHSREGKELLHLRGMYSNSCMTIPKVEIRHQENVVVVLPYLQLTDGVSCKSTEQPYEITKQIEEPLPAKFLLHVRSMGGQAINKVVMPGFGEQR